MLIQAR